MYLGLLYSRFFQLKGGLSSLPNCGRLKPKKGNQLSKVVELPYGFLQDKKSKVYHTYISSKLKTITENMKIIFNNIFYSLTSSSSLGAFDFSSFLMTSIDEVTVRP